MTADQGREHDATLRQIVAACTVLRDYTRRADYDAHRAERARQEQDPPGPDESPRARGVPLYTGPPVILGQLGLPRMEATVGVVQPCPRGSS